MAGGTLRFGQTYTYNDNGRLLNLTILSAAYSPGLFNLDPREGYNANNAQKVLIIHYRIKNPNSADMYYGSGGLFQAIDGNGNTIRDIDGSRRESEKTGVGVQVKPGQGIDDLETAIVVPTQGAVSKLILLMGRAGTSDRVTRFPIGVAPNVIAPLPAPYADPSDKSGATLLADIPAVVGKTYHAGILDMSLDAIKLDPGPIGKYTADQGKEFLVATVTVTNEFFGTWYFSDDIKPTLKTDDDKITSHNQVKATHDEDFEGRTLDPGDTATERIILQVPTDADLKTFSLVNDMGDNGQSPAFIYDVSHLK